jgi:hypothetical protein
VLYRERAAHNLIGDRHVKVPIAVDTWNRLGAILSNPGPSVHVNPLSLFAMWALNCHYNERPFSHASHLLLLQILTRQKSKQLSVIADKSRVRVGGLFVFSQGPDCILKMLGGMWLWASFR